MPFVVGPGGDQVGAGGGTVGPAEAGVPGPGSDQSRDPRHE